MPCAACGATTGSVLTTQDRYGLPARFLACACGLRYLSPRMTPEGYAAFYRDGYRALVAQIFGKPFSLQEMAGEQWVYAIALANTIAPWFPVGSTLLDVGGSTGIVGRHFKSRWGYDVTVIDPSPDELALARDCATICGGVETVETLPTVDVALLCRTMEHLLEPYVVLRRLRAVAQVLIVDARDTDVWDARGRYQIDHPYAWTRPSLLRALDDTGWRPRQSWTRSRGKYFGYLCDRKES